MSLRDTTQIALLLAVGTVLLRIVMPAYGAGMKPDVALAMLFTTVVLPAHIHLGLIPGNQFQ